MFKKIQKDRRRCKKTHSDKVGQKKDRSKKAWWQKDTEIERYEERQRQE